MAAVDEARKNLQYQAYEELNGFFSNCEDHVVEIAILPPAIEPPDGFLMRDGSNVGISKKILALAFVEARQRFFEGLKFGNDQSCFNSSRVILLFDPEHITAANYRKRKLLMVWKKESGRDDERSHEFERLEKRELVFLDTILTSPLHRQSKSPTLWHHRFWLINLSLPLVHMHTDMASYSRFLKAELEAVFKAGEHHPKNYYAWQYARRLIVRAEELIQDAPEYRKVYHEVRWSWTKDMTTWCRKHPSDISGWSFLLFLLSKVDNVSERTTIIREVMCYAINFELKNESLWVFIRTALASGILQEEQHTLLDLLRRHVKAISATMTEAARSESSPVVALRWIESSGYQELESSRDELWFSSTIPELQKTSG
ncbi:hypothetical protein K491DRAFT_700524 [Lophiostoma macrostomum CBS 122681]|uniref:Protein prenylyltransferase n=1 Tax=Lophiostoma macrostomum CBS 122681 TaxID=1314788 RepID=A0A6A6TS29_9PLEO|nr:hypothetical protein K491DRAFT_700524 [Lophiostoma macrostomum CBS 122681]